MKKISCELITSFEGFIRDSIRGRRRLRSGIKISQGTIQGYQQTLRALTALSPSDMRIPNICHLRTQSPEQLRKQVRLWKQFAKQLREYFRKKFGYSDSYVQLHFKNLKTFFHYMEREKGWRLGPIGSCFCISPNSITPIVLSPEQVRYLLFDNSFKGKLTRTLQRNRIIFLLGCFTGLRFSDLMGLRKTNLIQGNNYIYIRLVTKKTGQLLEIPLPVEANELLSELKSNRTVYLLPRISSVNFNLQIKKLIKIAGWSFPLPKYQSQGGKLVELKKEGGRSWFFHEHITAHTMRRTAITTLLRLGVQENLVRAISGHAAGSKEFYKYVSLSNAWLEQEVLAAWSNLKLSVGRQ